MKQKVNIFKPIEDNELVQKSVSFVWSKYSYFARDGFWKVNRMDFVSWFPELPATPAIMSLHCHNFSHNYLLSRVLLNV